MKELVTTTPRDISVSPSTDDTDAPLPMAHGDNDSTHSLEGLGGTEGSPGDSKSGVSTGGFDTMLGKLVVESGLVTKEELDLANQLVKEASGEQPRTLSDALLDNEFLTKRQLDRIREEFDTKRSSQQIPGYRILKKLGSGAMATVFLGKQLSLDRNVAIKVLPKKFSANPNFIERFYKEGRAAAKLNDPNIVAAYDVGQAGDHHYFVMEYVDGATVYDRIKEEKRIPESEALDIIVQMARALKHAHGAGFIHRDIKPKNIMLTSRGDVKLADLGLARAITDKEAAEAEAGRAYGTPYYISPEQIRGERKIGPQADIYGLGATFYHMVTGRVPYEGKNPSAVMHKHLKNDLTPPDHLNPKLSAGTALVIEMMMAKGPSDRYQSAADLLTDLELVRHGKPPHFAKKDLDLTKIAQTLTGPANLPPVQVAPANIGGVSRGVFSLMLVLLGLSVVINLVLLIVALSN